MPIDLFSMLDEAQKNSCQNIVMESSSHGLEQKRIYSLKVDVAIFTNLTQDHLDFHTDFEHYFAAKKKLFSSENENFPQTSIINRDDQYGSQLYDKYVQKIHMLSLSVYVMMKIFLYATSAKMTFLARNFRYKQMRISSIFLPFCFGCITYTT